MDTQNLQARVYNAVEKRGYVAGWTPVRFIARQVAKLAEEVAELAAAMLLPGVMQGYIQESGRIARGRFDVATPWRAVKLLDAEQAAAELADCQVVIFAAAEALRRSGLVKDFDVLAAAVAKAEADVTRGTAR